MLDEYELVLLACSIEKTKEQKNRIDILLKQKLDWERITGFIFQNRLAGYFFYGLTDSQKNYLAAEFYKTLQLICKIQKDITIESAKYYSKMFEEFQTAGIRYCALKGLVYNVTMYKPGARRSNDADILVVEEDLDKLDNVFRKEGFIQCFLKRGYKEASRKEKLIQRMNYHDLVPYVKKIDGQYIENLKFDINFHIDSKDNEITKKCMEYGIRNIHNELYNVRVLSNEMQLAHLCIHFYREATEKIWTSKRRDVTLYKVVDIYNTILSYGNEFDYISWMKLMKEYHIHKQAYFTLLTVAKFYSFIFPNSLMEMLKRECEFENDDLREIHRVSEAFYLEAFNNKYSVNFENVL